MLPTLILGIAIGFLLGTILTACIDIGRWLDRVKDEDAATSPDESEAPWGDVISLPAHRSPNSGKAQRDHG